MNFREKLSYLGVVMPTFSTALSSMFSPVSVDGTDGSGDPIGVGGLNARMYRSWPTNARLLEDWARLSMTLANASVFTSPAWQSAIARPFDRVGRFRVCSVHSGDYTCAVLPLQVGEGNVLETAGAMISDYLEPLVDEDFREPAWRSLLRLLNTQCKDYDAIVLHNLPADGQAYASLREFAESEGFELTDEHAAQSSRIKLPATWDDYLAALQSHDRKEIRRKVNKAMSKANARLTSTTSGADLPEALDRVFSFMQEAGGAKGTKARWSYRPLFKRVTPLLAAANRMEVLTLWLNDQPAAGLISFPSNDGPMLWAAGFDHEQASWSPGIVLFAMALRRSIDAGAIWFDLLRGQMRYKEELGPTVRDLRRITLRPR